jgi:hypothetical protein
VEESVGIECAYESESEHRREKSHV